MKVRSQRYGRWLGLVALALAVAAIAAPAGGARPLGGLPCDPGCGTTVGVQSSSRMLPGGTSGSEMERHRNSAVPIGSRPAPRGPGSLDPVAQPLYPVTAPLSGPATVPTDATPVTTDAPGGGTDWRAIGIAAGMGALLLGAAILIIGTNRRRQTATHA